MASEQTEVDRAFLTRIPIFAGLPDQVIDLIAATVRVVHVVPGAQLLREGEHARSMFVVREGELQILKRGRDGAEYKLAVLKAGDVVVANMGMTAEAMWSAAVGTTTHPAMPVVTD